MICRRTFFAAAAAAFIALATFAQALVLAPATAFAQQLPKTPRVALLDRGEPTANMTEESHPWWGALLREMRELGYIEGQTVIIERWSGRGHPDHAELARTIVDSRPDVIVARGRTAIRNFRTATTTIPIVGIGTFPADLQARLARPGGNVTGFSSSIGDAIYQKRVQLLVDAVPTASRIAWIVTRSSWEGTTGGKTREAAEQLGIEFVAAIVESPVGEVTIRRAFAILATLGADALVVSNSAGMVANRRLVVELALASKLPTIDVVRQYAELGIMMTYGADLRDLYRRAATYVDRILNGTDPGELPIQLPTTFDFIINLKTVRALGITLPPEIMIRATEFIE